MKTILPLALALLVAAPMQAQILRPESVNGAVLGGIAGAVIGNNSGDLHHNAWRGAAYGAGAGLLLGSLVGEAREYRHGHEVPAPAPRTYVYRESPRYYSGYRYRTYPSYPAYSSRVVYRDAYDYGDYDSDATYERPNYAANGLLLGGLAGAIIGNNSGDLGHNAWRGAAWGAGAGYLLGAIAEHNARRREAALTRMVASPVATEAEASPAAGPAPAAEPVPAAPRAPVSPMASANRLFGRD